MPELKDKARRWSGYVCPECRFVFRIPKDHDGEGVVCQSCRRMLRLPRTNVNLPPLVKSYKEFPSDASLADKSEQAPDAGHPDVKLQGDKRKRKMPVSDSGSQTWENKAGQTSPAVSPQGRHMLWWVTGGMVVFAVIVAIVIKAMVIGGDPASPIPVRPPNAEPSGTAAVVQPTPEQGKGDAAMTDAAIADAAKPVIRRFLEATTIDEMLSCVRNPETASARMRAFYRGGRIDAPGFKRIQDGSALVTYGSAYSISVVTRDYRVRMIAFFETPKGIRIDWESWVGWSEMPWADFIATKPQTAKLFRVNLKPVDYYNFSFSDERVWRSFRLISADGEQVIFGYAQRRLDPGYRLRAVPEADEIPMTLMLKFPENAQSDNQVIIDDVVANGWVLEKEESR